MFRYILWRMVSLFLVLFMVSVAAFLLLHLAGDPSVAIAGEGASAAAIEHIRSLYGFDKPLLVQYIRWLADMLAGDFGQSYYFHMPVLDLIKSRMPVTMTLGTLSILFAWLVAIPTGVAAALYRDSMVDRVSQFIAVVGQALPNFWLALLLVSLFSIRLGWVPSSGSDSWESYILPVVVLGYYATPALMRLMRASMLDVLPRDYIRTARAKGASRARVVIHHALRNALLPLVNLTAVELAFMLGGSIVIETVFALNGLGYLAWQSISRNDLPTIQILIMFFASLYVILTFVADLLNMWINPRLRASAG